MSEAAQVHKFAAEVCGQDAGALEFCHLWFTYCHGIDDLIDTREDGRPTMPPDAILGLFANAAALYSCPFYRAHWHMLFPVVLSITNAYADSVAWERSPQLAHRRIADVLRCCGNEMFFVVAMLVGGWPHARALSQRIREHSWSLQHDAEGNPLAEDSFPGIVATPPTP